MKLKFGLFLAAALATSVIAQVNPGTPAPSTPTAPAAPAPTPVIEPPAADATASTNAPAKVKKTKKKKAAKKATTSAKKDAAKVEAPAPVSFATNDLAVAKQSNVNIRGQARINSEVIGHLQPGEAVTVLGEITLKHPKTDEPAHWVQIALPASLHVWVDAAYIDKSNQVVIARKLNLRGGPGENYSVLGILHKGDSIKPIENKGNWIQIESPATSFGYVAAHLLAHKEAEPVTPPQVAQQPVPTVVQTPEPIPAPNNNLPPAGQPLPQPVAPVMLPQPVIIPAPAAPAVEEPLPKRIVQRDGIVGGAVSIQAPSHFELHNIDNGDTMDYLYTTSTNVVLSRYKGLMVHVTGEESLDERWPNTPVLTIQRIQKIVK